ncbi:hypothetical protein H2248_010806 [Termitomyces sp. 'cryptogamus']|nr:hypothetical protein H2248_010806 [Termitomyces sp. 'cryptogamus']
MMTSGESTVSVQQENCRFFQRGRCTFGEACLNHHQRASCVFFALGKCENGADCSFAHITPSPQDTAKNDLQLKPAVSSDEKGPRRPKCRFWESGTCRNGKNCRFAHPSPTETADRISDPVPTFHNSSSATVPTSDTPALSISGDGNATSEIVESKEEQSDNAEVKVVISNEDLSTCQCTESTDNELDAKTGDDNSCCGHSPYKVRENHLYSENGDTTVPLEEWGDEAFDGTKEDVANGDQESRGWGDELSTSPPCEMLAPPADMYDHPHPGQVEKMGSARETTVDSSSREFCIESPPESLGNKLAEAVHVVEQDTELLDSDSTRTQTDPKYLMPDLHTETKNTSYFTEAGGSEPTSSPKSSYVHLDAISATNVAGNGLSHLPDNDHRWSNNYQNLTPPLVMTQHWSQYADPTADLRVPFCRFHAQGQCSHGSDCRFRHSLSPNEFALLFHDPQPQLGSCVQPVNNLAAVSTFNVCKFYPLGKCRNGDACPYLHAPFTTLLPNLTEEPHPALSEAERRLQPCKYYSNSGYCNRGDQCYYSHNIEFGKAPLNNEDRVEGELGVHAQWSENQQAMDGNEGPNRPCKWFREGECRYGDKCNFLHETGSEDNSQREGSPSNASDWRQRRGQWNEVQKRRNGESRPCKWYLAGNCPLGDRCQFLHDSWRVEGTGNTDVQSFVQVEHSLQDDGAYGGDWGNNSGDWGDGWVSKEENVNTEDNEQPEAVDSIAQPSADVDDGWSANAAGWGDPIDEWSFKNENLDANSSPRSLNRSTFKNKENFDATSQSHARGQHKRGRRSPFSHDITDGQYPMSKSGSGQRQVIAEKGGWVQMPHEDKHDLWTVKKPCPYYRKGHCKKGMQCNLSHSSDDTSKSGNSRQATPRSTTSSRPVRPRSTEPSQPVSHTEEQPNVPAIVVDHWQTPQGGTEPSLIQRDVDGWVDSENENEHTPWAFPPKPLCRFFLQGHCKKGDQCLNRHEIPSGKSQNGGEVLSTTETSESAERSRSDSLIEVSSELQEKPIFAEQAKKAVEDEMGPATRLPPSSKDDSDEHASDPKSSNDDEKTWSVDWPQPDTESLPPPKVQAPCKAFGQGHCPMGDSCLYLHIVDTSVEDQGPSRLPATAPIEGEIGSAHVNEPERPGIKEGSSEEVGTDEEPVVDTAAEGELVVERTLFNCNVRFGLDNGCSPTEVVATSDTYRAIISNLPPDISHAEAVELVRTTDEENGFQALELDPDQTQANVIARFTTPQQAEDAVIKLHGQMFGSRSLRTWRTEESIQPPMESRTVRIKWSAPSRSVWFYYPKISQAKEHEKRLDGMNVDGRKIKAEFARPRPSDRIYAVKISGFHVNTDEQEYKRLAQDTQMVHKNAPTYIVCPLDDIRDTLAARGSLERFYRLPLDPKSTKHAAFARFEHGLGAVLDAHGKQQAYLDKGSLSLQTVFHANYPISDRTYQAISRVLENLSETVTAAQCTLDVYYGADPPVDIHLYADAASVAAATFGKVNRALYSVMLGEVMMTEEDTPVPIWDEYFEMTSSSRAIEKLNEDTSFFVRIDKRRRLVMVLGDEANRTKARKGMLKLLKLVRAQRHVIPLDLRSIRILVDGGYMQLQEKLRGAHKVTLDLAVPELVVRGDVEFGEATAILAAAASENSSTADVDDMEDCCFVCKRRPQEPVKLSCTHVYCMACLQYVLLASAGAHFAPPRCLAGCEEYIPYITVRDVLPMAAEAALLENAFLAYVRANEEYFFCPLPHCKTVFRRLAEGRVGSVCYTCVSCMRKVCAMCGEEYHEGIDCTARDDSIG